MKIVSLILSFLFIAIAAIFLATPLRSFALIPGGVALVFNSIAFFIAKKKHESTRVILIAFLLSGLAILFSLILALSVKDKVATDISTEQKIDSTAVELENADLNEAFAE